LRKAGDHARLDQSRQLHVGGFFFNNLPAVKPSFNSEPDIKFSLFKI
jgi:hypothetical protein